eukprot:gnl/MRDRNA2_/MRDRNA2_113999_c0_seq1.p1 gnl/MRDRNA2_/MRDRNA2_113999_c0~~gnl/MRDRNA2_/MRDRNA2_113999_c0_seq1.p1  ORF type:complete len:113 (-),score=6.47 gnl/MRDRNA2_/MRDRNA2_113999_c0_seq1:169-507(-)
MRDGHCGSAVKCIILCTGHPASDCCMYMVVILFTFSKRYGVYSLEGEASRHTSFDAGKENSRPFLHAVAHMRPIDFMVALGIRPSTPQGSIVIGFTVSSLQWSQGVFPINQN